LNLLSSFKELWIMNLLVLFMLLCFHDFYGSFLYPLSSFCGFD
jgi:hypothetical protein